MARSFIYTALVLTICCLVAVSGASQKLFGKKSCGQKGYGPGKQDWGFIDVRPGAHMFYWLYYTTAKVHTCTDRPLAIWLQGGPGASSTGYGNFEELGPLTLEGKHRSHTWVKDMNVIFIDNPVGSGFSYVDNTANLTTTNNEIALDLVSFMKGFYKLHPEFEKVPLHIFCESYGGKMAPEFALELYYAIQRKEIRSNLKSVALGDPWTSPVDSVNAWAPLLLNMGIVNKAGAARIATAAKRTETLVNAGQWTLATLQWSTTQGVVLSESCSVDFYNVLKETAASACSNKLRSAADDNDFMLRTTVRVNLDEDRDQILEDLMRTEVSDALNIPSNVVWGSQSSATFTRLMGDFMKPVVHIVDELLTNTTLRVGVFSGQLDLICATPGTVNWIEKMQWQNKTQYDAATRRPISVDRVLEGFEQGVGQFTMYWIDRAGHMVPADNAAGMDHILRNFTQYHLM